MKPRLILVLLGVFALTILSLGIQAQEQPKGAPTQDGKDDIFNNEQQLARLFADFQNSLLILKQRLARGTPEEKKRAEELGKVLDECKNLAINQEFVKMIELLRLANINNTGDLGKLKDQSDNLATRLAKILNMIQDTKADRLSTERKELEAILKKLKEAIEKQEIVEAIHKLGKTDKDELQRNQEKVTDFTKGVEKDFGKYLDKDNKGGEAANQKGSPKDGGKEEGAKGEAKNDGSKPSEGAKGEAKDGGKPSEGAGAKGETKPGDKANQGGKTGDQEPKAGAKSDKGQEGSPQAGAKDDKSGKKGEQGNAKDNQGDKKPGQEGGAKDSGKKDGAKDGGAQGAAKGDDKQGGGDKAGGAPDSQAKPGGGSEPKIIPNKSEKGADKGGDAKAGGAAKAGEPGSAAGDSKSGDSKDGQGQAKDGGASAGGGGDMPPGGGGQAKDGGGGQPPPPGGNKQNDDAAKSKKKIEEAGYDQKAAEDNIAKEQKEKTAKNQADAIQKLKDAQRELEKLLRQMREEELERVLAALQARCEKMLMMQLAVLAGTEDTDKAIAKTKDKLPTRDNKLESLRLADKEKEIVQEANKCIDILEAEGSAVAFPEVFQQVRQDMIHVQKRLELTDVGDLTQGIEKDIIATLKEMIEALKKAREDNQSDPGKGQPGKAGQPGNQKLLELIQELKMVRALQKRINDRTVDYAKRFPGQEQTADPQVVRELRNLAERQSRIQEIVNKIARGDNK